MKVINSIKKILKPRLDLVKGTRFVSFLFIGCSVLIAAGILWAASMYYNIDTGEVVTEEIQRTTGLIRAVGGVIVAGTSTSTLPSEVALEIATTSDVLLSGANQRLRFSGGTGYYVGFKASTGLTTTTTYTWPTVYPTSTGQVLQSTVTGALSWLDLGAAGFGDILAVGDCPTGECFTSDGTSGTSLWFYDSGYRTKLTTATLSDNHTITLPNATGTVALGTGTSTYVAYWSDANTLAGEQYLSTSRGGIGEDSSAWNGMVQVVGGDWGVITGTPGYAAYWSNATTVAAEQHLDVTRGGTGVGSFTQYGVLYGMNTADLGVTTAGDTNQILISGGGASAPSWANIASLLTAGSGINLSGTTNVTINLGGALATTTTITQGNYDMIFALTGTGDFRVTDGTNNIFRVTDDGRVLYGANDFPLAEPGKQILREMIPIMGFDLPVQTATTSYVPISRTIEDYPFSATSSGTTRVHKFVIRYADATTTVSTTWRVYNVTDSATTTTFQVPATASTDLEKGEAYITPDVTVPTDTDDWRLDLLTPGSTIRVYQIFLAAYDQIQ